MLDLMTWKEVVDSLQQEGGLKMAGIFDLQGDTLAATEGVSISSQEVQGVLQSLRIPATSLYALCVGGQKVNCMRVDGRTLLGRTYDEVFVAYRTNDVLICAFTPMGGSSSCLASVRDFALKLNMQPLPDAVASPSLI